MSTEDTSIQQVGLAFAGVGLAVFLLLAGIATIVWASRDCACEEVTGG